MFKKQTFRFDEKRSSMAPEHTVQPSLDRTSSNWMFERLSEQQRTPFVRLEQRFISKRRFSDERKRFDAIKNTIDEPKNGSMP